MMICLKFLFPDYQDLCLLLHILLTELVKCCQHKKPGQTNLNHHMTMPGLDFDRRGDCQSIRLLEAAGSFVEMGVKVQPNKEYWIKRNPAKKSKSIYSLWYYYTLNPDQLKLTYFFKSQANKSYSSKLQIFLDQLNSLSSITRYRLYITSI